jgi:hypothetical protein
MAIGLDNQHLPRIAHATRTNQYKLMNDDEILIFLASLLASLERPQKKSLADA